jgi:hypothetical protein
MTDVRAQYERAVQEGLGAELGDRARALLAFHNQRVAEEKQELHQALLDIIRETAMTAEEFTGLLDLLPESHRTARDDLEAYAKNALFGVTMIEESMAAERVRRSYEQVMVRSVAGSLMVRFGDDERKSWAEMRVFFSYIYPEQEPFPESYDLYVFETWNAQRGLLLSASWMMGSEFETAMVAFDAQVGPARTIETAARMLGARRELFPPSPSNDWRDNPWGDLFR